VGKLELRFSIRRKQYIRMDLVVQETLNDWQIVYNTAPLQESPYLLIGTIKINNTRLFSVILSQRKNNS